MLRLGLLLSAWLVAGSAYAQEDTSSILSSGLRAEAVHDGQGLLEAAQALDQSGAHPADGTPDLARQWRLDAAQMGVRDDTPPWRGRTLGASYRRGRVGAHRSYITHQSFNAGQEASVSLVAMDGGPLSLTVHDEDGNEACSTDASGREGGCRWVPVWSGSFEISVINYGDDEATYYLVTN